MSQNKMYQNIALVLTDGRIIYASVPVFFNVGDPPISVSEFKISPPQKLPDECFWEENDDEDGTKS
jgi:hypothetical protein